MQESLLLALQGSLAICLVLVVTVSNLKKYNIDNRRLLMMALVFAFFVSLVFHSFYLPLLDSRQSFDAQTAIIATFALIILLAGVLLPEKSLLIKKNKTFFSWLNTGALAAVSFFFALDILVYFEKIFKINSNFITSDMVIRLSLGVLSLLLTVVLAFSTTKLISDRLALYYKIAFSLSLLAIAIRSVTVSGQMLLVIGQIPANPTIYNVVTWLINQTNNLFNVVIASFIALALLALVNRPRLDKNIKNSAEFRKIKAKRRSNYRASLTAFASIALIISFIYFGQSVAGRQVELSVAKPVKADDSGKVILRTRILKDKKLHRFSYTSSQGKKIRFIVVYKGSGIYGSALDACELCGAAGYYQKGQYVICRKCNSVINKTTVGFPGGCNPIPITSKESKGRLEINTKALESKQEVFK